MYVLQRLRVWLSQAFYRWALREINPLHPDVAWLLMRQRELLDQERRLWGSRAKLKTFSRPGSPCAGPAKRRAVNAP